MLAHLYLFPHEEKIILNGILLRASVLDLHGFTATIELCVIPYSVTHCQRLHSRVLFLRTDQARAHTRTRKAEGPSDQFD